MKKLLIALLVLCLVGAAAFFGFKNIDKILPQKGGENSPSEERLDGNSDSDKSQSIEFGVLDEDKSGGDSEKLQRAIENNKDAVAWLKLPGTSISAPVMQSYDNNFYLRRNENKESDIFGCYFADCENNLSRRQELDGNIVIYGHSDLKDDPNGQRFSKLFNYIDEDFARKNNKIILTLPSEELEFEIFSVCYSSGNPSYININSKGSPENGAIIKNALKNSVVDFGVDVSADDNIIILSTCSVKEGTNFLAVMGRLLEN